MTGACADMPSRTCSSSKAAAKQEEPCGNGDAIDDIQDKGQAAAAKAARAACKHGEQEDSDDDWDEEMLAELHGQALPQPASDELATLELTIAKEGDVLAKQIAESKAQRSATTDSGRGSTRGGGGKKAKARGAKPSQSAANKTTGNGKRSAKGASAKGSAKGKSSAKRANAKSSAKRANAKRSADANAKRSAKGANAKRSADANAKRSAKGAKAKGSAKSAKPKGKQAAAKRKTINTGAEPSAKRQATNGSNSSGTDSDGLANALESQCKVTPGRKPKAMGMLAKRVHTMVNQETIKMLQDGKCSHDDNPREVMSKVLEALASNSAATMMINALRSASREQQKMNKMIFKQAIMKAQAKWAEMTATSHGPTIEVQDASGNWNKTNAKSNIDFELIDNMSLSRLKDQQEKAMQLIGFGYKPDGNWTNTIAKGGRKKTAHPQVIAIMREKLRDINKEEDDSDSSSTELEQ